MVKKPSGWVWHQAHSGDAPFRDRVGTAYTIREAEVAGDERVEQLRATVLEIAGIAPADKKPCGFGNG